jgi:RNA polymerase sigma-70 factor (ECF subfamily)
LQEVFVICAREWDAMDAARSKQAWLIGIARNLIRGHFRRRKDVNPEALLDVVQEREVQTDANDDISTMRMAIAGLPVTFREVIELRLADELSYAEIAEGLGIPVGSVRSRLHHAVKLLREAIVQNAEVAKRGAH